MAAGQVPVLAVGAGPTGLTMALELARQGVVARVIEQLTLLRTTGRASSRAVVPPRWLRVHRLLPGRAPRLLGTSAVRRWAAGSSSRLRIGYPDSTRPATMATRPHQPSSAPRPRRTWWKW